MSILPLSLVQPTPSAPPQRGKKRGFGLTRTGVELGAIAGLQRIALPLKDSVQISLSSPDLRAIAGDDAFNTAVAESGDEQTVVVGQDLL